MLRIYVWVFSGDSIHISDQGRTSCCHHSIETGWTLQPKFGLDVETDDTYIQRMKKFINHILSFSEESRANSQADSRMV